MPVARLSGGWLTHIREEYWIMGMIAPPPAISFPLWNWIRPSIVSCRRGDTCFASSGIIRFLERHKILATAYNQTLIVPGNLLTLLPIYFRVPSGHRSTRWAVARRASG